MVNHPYWARASHSSQLSRKIFRGGLNRVIRAEAEEWTTRGRWGQASSKEVAISRMYLLTSLLPRISTCVLFVARNTANKRQIIIGYLDQRIRHEFVSSLLQFTIRLLRVKNYEEFLWRSRHSPLCVKFSWSLFRNEVLIVLFQAPQRDLIR